jgi:hypothetical protein
MSDAAGFGQVTMRARLTREIGESECKQRNALSIKRPGLTLREGAQVTVLDTLEQGKAFLVEFGNKSPDACDWLGVLYPSEIELEGAGAQHAVR